MRRKFPRLLKTTALVLVALFVFIRCNQSSDRSFSRADLTSLSPFSPGRDRKSPWSIEPLPHGNPALLELAPPIIHAILNREDKTFARLECPAPILGRYDYLRSPGMKARSLKRVRYFFALNLHQNMDVLPRLLGSIVETMHFLGPENCALSIVEGRSNDGTFEVLKLLSSEIRSLGAQYHFASSNVDPSSSEIDRIEALAELRNLALAPLWDHPEHYSTEATAIFLNDVSICHQDILELIHQKAYQGADMTCAMDWTFAGADPTFYDVWIARGMTGDLFFQIPEDGNWNSAWNLFWNDDKARQHLDAQKPFQVFACWNGATAFTARPILDQKIRFRGATDAECYEGEPKLFCKDMWHQGFGKIAVVPSVNVEYSDGAAQKIKALKGYASDIVTDNEDRIDWDPNPPANVKCMRNYWDQTWPAWNEGL